MTRLTTSDDKDHHRMKRFLAPFAAIAVAALATSTVLVGLSAASSATAASAKPPWEPDHHSKGGLIFYNSKGTKITSGKLTSAPFAAYVRGAVALRSGDTKATLLGYLPKKGQVPGQFSGDLLTTSDPYPNSKAPTALRKSTLPLVSLTKNDTTLGQFFQEFPNPAKSGNTYSGLYELRLVTSKPGKSQTQTYDSADIAVSGVTTSSTGAVTGGTWKLVYSVAVPIATHTTLKVTPHSVKKGHKVKLVATVSPKVAGTVSFRNGSKLLKKVKVKSSGKATFVTKKLKKGTHKLRAIFTPTSKPYVSSKSKVVKVKVKK
jgi:hypothetical protein